MSADTDAKELLAKLLEDRELMTESQRLGTRQLAIVGHTIVLLTHGTPAEDVLEYLVDEYALLQGPITDQIARVRARLLQ